MGMAMKRLAGLALCLLWGFPAVAQQAGSTGVSASFCSDLKAVVPMAADSFDGIRGDVIGTPEKDAQGYVSTKFKASKAIAGANTCYVDHYDPPDGEVLKSYVCEWLPPAGTKAETTKTLAIATEQCVGVGDDLDTYTTYGKDTADADIYTDGFEINIGAGTDPHVFFTVRPN
jgi:hypothetical protein